VTFRPISLLGFSKRFPGPLHSGEGRNPVFNASIIAALLVLSSNFYTACRTFEALPAVNLTEAGWTVYQGQAVWRLKRTAPEIAGELLLARHQDGRSLVQFIKTPFPILTAQITRAGWQIEFVPELRSFSGRGKPPARLIWLYLAPCLFDNAAPPKNWTWESGSAERDSRFMVREQIAKEHVATKGDNGTPLQFRFENKSTGETLEGYLSP
jgi:hypothetical protein